MRAKLLTLCGATRLIDTEDPPPPSLDIPMTTLAKKMGIEPADDRVPLSRLKSRRFLLYSIDRVDYLGKTWKIANYIEEVPKKAPSKG